MPKTSPARAIALHSAQRSVRSRCSAARRQGNDATASTRESGPRPPSSPCPGKPRKDPPRFRSIPACRESSVSDCKTAWRESSPPYSHQCRKEENSGEEICLAFNATMDGGGFSSSALRGTGVLSGYRNGSLRGAFYGPAAGEAGGVFEGSNSVSNRLLNGWFSLKL